MKTYQVQLLEPNAERLLEELVRLKLISCQEMPSPKQFFSQLLAQFRQKEDDFLDLEDITKEVEAVRAKRYNK
jgi:hypothetical protein